MVGDKATVPRDYYDAYNSTAHFAIGVQDDEIAISTRDFNRMLHGGLFINDTVCDTHTKLKGRSKDGVVYVSERCDFGMTSAEFKAYYEERRKWKQQYNFNYKYCLFADSCVRPFGHRKDGSYYMSVLAHYASIVDIGCDHITIA